MFGGENSAIAIDARMTLSIRLRRPGLAVLKCGRAPNIVALAGRPIATGAKSGGGWCRYCSRRRGLRALEGTGRLLKAAYGRSAFASCWFSLWLKFRQGRVNGGHSLNGVSATRFEVGSAPKRRGERAASRAIVRTSLSGAMAAEAAAVAGSEPFEKARPSSYFKKTL